jgi:hypothetical protein
MTEQNSKMKKMNYFCILNFTFDFLCLNFDLVEK